METLTRAQVAERLACSKSNVRALEKAGKLHPEVDAQGRYLFDADEVAALGRARRASGVRGGREPSAGETAARAFELFEKGTSFRECVKLLQQTPERIDELWEEYCHHDFHDRARRRQDAQRQEAERQRHEERREHQSRRAERWQQLLSRVGTDGGTHPGDED